MKLTLPLFLLSASLSYTSGFTFSHTPKRNNVNTKSTSLQSTAEGRDDEDPLLIQAAKGQKTERTPVWMMRQAGRHIAEYRELCKTYPTFRQRSEIPDVAVEVSLQPVRNYDTDGCILFSDILTPLPGIGAEFQIDEKLGPVMNRPIRSWEDLKTLRPLDPTASTPFVGETLQLLKEAIKPSCALLGFVGCPYTLATYLVEGKSSKLYLETKKLATSAPDLFHAMLKLLADQIGDYACYQIENGAQLIQIFDSWAGELAPRDYDEFAAPYQKMVLDKIKAKHPHIPTTIYIKHSGALIERMAETGADIIGLDWTVDLAEGRKRIDAARSEIGFNTPGGVQGNLDPCLLFASQDVIKERTEEILKKGGGVGHVMNLGHGIEAMTSEENAAFFIETVRNFRHD